MDEELQHHLQQALGDAFAIERELGGGGMSRVFLAVERSLGRRVVIKVLPPELFTGVSEARFHREVLVTANLQHPHILPVLAAGLDAEIAYYLMPYVDGHTLRERLLLAGALPILEATSILRELAGALAYAHQRGVIHRDVKPENVLLSAGHAVLSDFGIARAMEQAQGDGLTGVGLVGTVGYMAPEQLAGDGSVDARADVFALGVVGYEMFAGDPPFTGETPHALAAAYFTTPPPRLDVVRRGVPSELADVIGRALSSAPDARYPSAVEMLDALQQVDAARAAGRRARRRRARIVVAAGALVLASAGAAFGGWIASRGRVEPAGPKTIAVLPFKNMGAPDDMYFADGITEEVTSRLASLSGLGVISRTSADQYRNSTKPLKQIARELGASYILEGSVRWDRSARGGGRVRVTPQLIRVSDDSHLWADRFDGDPSDVFAVQTRIAEREAGALAIALAGDERHHMGTRPTSDFAAYELYIRGERLLTREWQNTTSLTEATELLTRATNADPRFALAFAKLAEAHAIVYNSMADHTPQRIALARRAADSAIALDPLLPDGHLALGLMYEIGNDLERSSAEYALAERGRPSDSNILARTAGLMARRGQWAGAMVRLRRAADLDPRSVAANVGTASGAWLTRDHRAAMKYVERAIAADSGAMLPHMMKARIALTLGGDRALARATADEVIRRFGAERAASADGFDQLVGALDTADRATLARVGPAAFSDNRLLWLYWRVHLFERWQPALERAYADSLLRFGEPLIRAENPDYRVLATAGWLSAILGQPDSALALTGRALEAAPKSGDQLLWADAAQAMARTYARLGESDAALDQIEQLLTVPSWMSVPWLRTDPTWAALRANPRFQRLVGSGA